jgi:cytochrome o ubiquinol oxidase subunit II
LQTPAWQQGVLDPQGPIAAAERTILANATVIMLAVIVPVILLTLAFAWWFRAGNAWARRDPEWAYSGPIEVTVWAIPTLVVLFLGGIAWIGSHELDPARPVASAAPPLEVQVVSMDWKWLFIYPDLGVASVNRLVVPAGTPLRLHLTSASVMNSFFVPQLGSQIYTMAGMTTTLHLQADRPGTYAGLSAQFSGDGFSDMRFDTIAVAPAQFTQWLATARSNTDTLDASHYAALARPGVPASAATFGRVAPGLFQTILATSARPPAPALALALATPTQ